MQDWKKYLDEFIPSTDLKDEIAAIRVCQLAAIAAKLDTYGVGAVLLDDKGRILIEGHNEVYVNNFRSDLHAEMVVMNKFETTKPRPKRLGNYTLVTSLEPCPMCMTRLIFSGVGTILYVKADDIGGMVQRKSSLPPIFQQISEDQSQVWRQAECSEDLREAAFQIWDQSRVELDQRIISRGSRRKGNT